MGSLNHSSISIVCGIAADRVEELVKERLRPYEELSSAQKELIASLREKLSLNSRQFYTALEILNVENIPAEQLPTKLSEIAASFKSLEAAGAVQPGDDPGIVSLKQKVKRAILSGDIEEADRTLAAIEDFQKRIIASVATSTAQTINDRGELLLIRFKYRGAATKFSEAADLVNSGGQHRKDWIRYKTNQVIAEFSDRFFGRRLSELRPVIDLADAVAKEAPGVAALQALIGIGLLWISFDADEPEQRDKDLRRAVTAMRLSLAAPEDDRYPLSWKVRPGNLGVALLALGNLSNDPNVIEEAVDTFRGSRAVRSAFDEANFGRALRSLGELRNDVGLIEQASAAFRRSLALRDPDKEEWAETQSNLGHALLQSAEMRGDPNLLVQAVDAFRAAEAKFDQTRNSRKWATAQHNLGYALLRLGQERESTKIVEDALVHLRASLAERKAGRRPINGDHVEIGNALAWLASRDPNRLGEALQFLQLALSEVQEEREESEYRAALRETIGILLSLKALRERDLPGLETFACAEAQLFPPTSRPEEAGVVDKCELAAALTTTQLHRAYSHGSGRSHRTLRTAYRRLGRSVRGGRASRLSLLALDGYEYPSLVGIHR